MSKTSKSPPTPETRLPDRFSRASAIIGIVARDPIVFRSVVDAFEAGDGKLFHHLLAELRVDDFCEVICAWLRSKESVLECLDVCGPPPQQPVTVEQVARFADVVTNLSEDEFLMRRVVDAVQDRDSVAFKAVVSELGAEQFCHLLCHWVSMVRYRLICRVVCCEQEREVNASVETDQVVAELTRAGAAVRLLAKKSVSLRSAIAAAVSSDVDSLSDIIGGFVDCHLICEWFCSWRCIWMCLPFCQSFPVPEVKDDIEEMRDFALFSVKLTENKEAFPRLLAALQSGDSKSFVALGTEFRVEGYCLQLCHWLCYEICSRWCIVVCPPPPAQPWFTTVGYFDIYSDIDSSTGLTNKSLPFPSLAYGGGPKFAFMGPLQLGGFCPSYSPTSPGTQMKYRFLYSISSSPPVPITGPLVSPVENTRIINWPENLAGIAGATLVPTFQSVIIEYSSTPLPPDPTPPASGAPWVAPSPHYMTPDVDGWVVVDPNAVGDGFQQLLGFNTTQVVIGGSAPGPGAGNPVPAAQQKGGTDMSITFEATRTTTLPPGTTPDFSNSLSKIHVNNWNEVNQLGLTEFATGCCTPINDALAIEFTVDHEQMSAGAWYAEITGCATPPIPEPIIGAGVVPPPTATLTARGGWGTIPENTTAWSSCSYIVWLYTRPGLTTGLVDRDFENPYLSFCIEHPPPSFSGTTKPGTTSNVLQDSSGTWTTNQWVGYYLAYTSGPANGLAALIIRNTATTITTAAAFNPAPDPSGGDTYKIIPPPP